MGHPNLLYIFTDQQRVDTLRCYGNEQIETPALDELAAAGFVFENAYVSQPVCSPARATMLTGLWPHTAGVPACNVPLCAEVPTFARCCRRNIRRPLWANGTWGMKFFPSTGLRRGSAAKTRTGVAIPRRSGWPSSARITTSWSSRDLRPTRKISASAYSRATPRHPCRRSTQRRRFWASRPQSTSARVATRPSRCASAIWSRIRRTPGRSMSTTTRKPCRPGRVLGSLRWPTRP